MRRNDVASTSFRRRVPIRFLINQCQIITFLILKYDIIENSRIELRGIVLPVQMGGLLGGGAKGMLAPPLKLLGGGGGGAGLAPPGPPPPPLFLRLWHILVNRIGVISSAMKKYRIHSLMTDMIYISSPKQILDVFDNFRLRFFPKRSEMVRSCLTLSYKR